MSWSVVSRVTKGMIAVSMFIHMRLISAHPWQPLLTNTSVRASLAAVSGGCAAEIGTLCSEALMQGYYNVRPILLHVEAV